MKPGVTDAELISQLNTAVIDEAERNSKLGIGQKGKAKVSKVESQAVSCKIGKDKPASQPSASLSELKEIRAEVATLKQEVYYKNRLVLKLAVRSQHTRKCVEAVRHAMIGEKQTAAGIAGNVGRPHILLITVLSHRKTVFDYCQGTTSSRPNS